MKLSWKQTSTFSQLEYHCCFDIQFCTTSATPDASCWNSLTGSLSQVGTKWHFVLGAQTKMSLHVWSNHQSHWWSHPIPGLSPWLSPGWNSEADFHFHKESMHGYAPMVGTKSSSTVGCKQPHGSTFQNSEPWRQHQRMELSKLHRPFSSSSVPNSTAPQSQLKNPESTPAATRTTHEALPTQLSSHLEQQSQEHTYVWKRLSHSSTWWRGLQGFQFHFCVST